MSTRAEQRRRVRWALRAALALLLGALVPVLVACGSSGKGLIPSSLSEPLRSDVEEVEQAAESGQGDCSRTEAASRKLEDDFDRLPATLNAGLRRTLSNGIANLHGRAMIACSEPVEGKTKTTTTTTTQTTTSTTPVETKTEPYEEERLRAEEKAAQEEKEAEERRAAEEGAPTGGGTEAEEESEAKALEEGQAGGAAPGTGGVGNGAEGVK